MLLFALDAMLRQCMHSAARFRVMPDLHKHPTRRLPCPVTLQWLACAKEAQLSSGFPPDEQPESAE